MAEVIVDVHAGAAWIMVRALFVLHRKWILCGQFPLITSKNRLRYHRSQDVSGRKAGGGDGIGQKRNILVDLGEHSCRTIAWLAGTMTETGAVCLHNSLYHPACVLYFLRPSKRSSLSFLTGFLTDLVPNPTPVNMSSESSLPSGVLLLGSIPLSSTEEVFNKIPAALPGRLFSIPDGETGIRDNYIRWQVDCFPKETIHQFLGGTDVPADHPGFTLDDIKPTRYDTVALESYQSFLKLREQNVIPPGVRFQVSLPLPLNCVQGHTRAKFHAQLDG
ncbi:hypothetical protein AbraIFM66950_005436, partial [Aspergillus brasiliensis]